VLAPIASELRAGLSRAYWGPAFHGDLHQLSAFEAEVRARALARAGPVVPVLHLVSGRQVLGRVVEDPRPPELPAAPPPPLAIPHPAGSAAAMELGGGPAAAAAGFGPTWWGGARLGGRAWGAAAGWFARPARGGPGPGDGPALSGFEAASLQIRPVCVFV
jgi:hypothetical protein